MPPARFLWPAAGLVPIAAAVAFWVARKLRVSPEERERRRRELINREGRLADGAITDIDGTVIFYTYVVRGVEYSATQDISGLPASVPADPARLLGPVTLKYLPRNPANSILICESWSGFRIR
jgi:hypothetical protein